MLLNVHTRIHPTQVVPASAIAGSSLRLAAAGSELALGDWTVRTMHGKYESKASVVRGGQGCAEWVGGFEHVRKQMVLGEGDTLHFKVLPGRVFEVSTCTSWGAHGRVFGVGAPCSIALRLRATRACWRGAAGGDSRRGSWAARAALRAFAANNSVA